MLRNSNQQIFLLGLSSLLAGFSLISILLFTDPFSAGLLTFIFLYLSLFIFCVGAFTLLGQLVRRLLEKGLFIHNLGVSFRQAILLAIFVAACLELQSQGLLYWWVSGSLLLFLATLEAFFKLKI